MANKYYLREDRKAVKLGDKIGDFWCGGCAVCEACQHEITFLPALDVDPDYLKTLSPGWFEGEERYEVFNIINGKWESRKHNVYANNELKLRRILIVAPQEDIWKPLDEDLATEKVQSERVDYWKTLDVLIKAAVDKSFTESGLKNMAINGSDGNFKEVEGKFFNSINVEQIRNKLAATPREAEKGQEVVKPSLSMIKAFEAINNISPTEGVKDCTYGDTEYDSMSAAYGYNQCLENIQTILSAVPTTPQPVTGEAGDDEAAFNEWESSIPKPMMEVLDELAGHTYPVRGILRRLFRQAASRPSDAVEFGDLIEDAVNAYFHQAEKELGRKDLGYIEERNWQKIKNDCQRFFTNSKSPNPNK